MSTESTVSNPDRPGLWQRWGNFLESHPRLFKAIMIGSAAVGAVTFGLDVADVAINEHVSLINAEMVPVSSFAIAQGAMGVRYINRNYLSDGGAQE